MFDLKVALRELTTVPEERQKILGLVKGKLPPDQERMYVSRLRIPLNARGSRVRESSADCLGTEETSSSLAGRSLHWSGPLKGTRSKIQMACFGSLVRLQRISDTHHRYPELLNLPDVVNDLDVDLAIDPVAAAAYINDQRNLRKIREHTAKLQLNIINPPRPGKRLLVLDIDYSKACMVFLWCSRETVTSDT